MSDTRALLNRIAALRHRLEQSPRLSEGPAEEPARPAALEQRTAGLMRQGELVDAALRPLTETAGPPPLPARLTARARRLLSDGMELVRRLREIGEAGRLETPEHEADPLAVRYRATVALADAALRTVQCYPDAPSAQLRLCAGLEAALDVVAERTAGLQQFVGDRRRESARVGALARLLLRLEADEPVEVAGFIALAEDLVAEVRDGWPLRFLEETHRPRNKEELARTAALHSLNVARVVARLTRHDADHSARPAEPVLAALVHDAGLLRVPADVYCHAGPLDDERKRQIEAHARRGGELAARLLPTAGWLAEAAGSHHEKLDGTGYPAGLKDPQIGPLVRLIAVADVYTALCTPRPYRPARDPRTALTDTLLLGERGHLDRTMAERLLQLGFYPSGAVVELADGCVGQVVAQHPRHHDINGPARPVVLLLTDPQGHALPAPRTIDLADCAGRSIVRTLPAEERRKVLGKQYPEVA